MRTLRRPRTCLYSVNEEGPRILSICGRCRVGFVSNVDRSVPSSSALHPSQSPDPPKSGRRTLRSSKYARAGSQSPSEGSSMSRSSSREYIAWTTALSEGTWRQALGLDDFARSIPREERRKPRCPSSVVRRRRNTHTPWCSPFVKYLVKKLRRDQTTWGM